MNFTITHFAFSELHERLVRHVDGHVGLWLRCASVDGAGLLEINGPNGLLALLVLDVEFEDALRLRKPEAYEKSLHDMSSLTHLVDLLLLFLLAVSLEGGF